MVRRGRGIRRGFHGVPTDLWRHGLTLALCAVVAGGCSGGEAGGATLPERSVAASDPSIIGVPTVPYRVLEAGARVAVTGSVSVVGPVPVDTVVNPTMDQRVCGRQFIDRTIAVRNGKLAGAVVWLTDVRAGDPLPLRRRFEVLNRNCLLEPRVQAVLAGGTLNVRNADAIPQRTRIMRQESGQTLAIVEQTTSGQVVPDDRVLTRPGLLELSSDLHPWTRGWIAIFDHPYFDISDANGGFVLGDVPPGNYTLAAWHERFGRIERRIVVTEGESVPLVLTFGDSTAAARPVPSSARSEGQPGR